MAGRVITSRQQQIIADCIGGLVLLLYSSNHQWNRQQRRDIEAAYAAVGVKPPFSFHNEPDAQAKPLTRWERTKAALNRPLWQRKPVVDEQPDPIVVP